MKYFLSVCKSSIVGHGPSSGQELRQAVSFSQSDSGVGTTAGGGPGSGLGSSSGTGADRAFRIVKSETMKRVDHKR